MPDETFSLDDFKGTARLFPLPNLVVFPHVVQPLHIFESRYVAMLEHAVADDRLLAMGVLMPGWETEYEGRPPVDPYVCLGRILSHSPTKDNQYNILLGGIARARIVKELKPKCSYREVALDVLDDEPLPVDDLVDELHAKLVKAFRNLIPEEMSSQIQLAEILDTPSELGTLTDLISYSLPLNIALRCELLGELNVPKRASMLLRRLEQHATTPLRDFPPRFSDN